LINLPGPRRGRVVLDGQVFITPFVEEPVNEYAGLLQVRLEAGKGGFCFRGEGRIYGYIVLFRNLLLL
jgi:hypothetical protein